MTVQTWRNIMKYLLAPGKCPQASLVLVPCISGCHKANLTQRRESAWQQQPNVTKCSEFLSFKHSQFIPIIELSQLVWLIFYGRWFHLHPRLQSILPHYFKVHQFYFPGVILHGAADEPEDLLKDTQTSVVSVNCASHCHQHQSMRGHGTFQATGMQIWVEEETFFFNQGQQAQAHHVCTHILFHVFFQSVVTELQFGILPEMLWSPCCFRFYSQRVLRVQEFKVPLAEFSS